MKHPKLGHGPWDDEPDRVEFKHAGLDCVLARNGRNGGGAWCGYVRVGESHPLHDVGYSESSEVLTDAVAARLEMPVSKLSPMRALLASYNTEPTPDLVFDVHGGITYAGKTPCGWIMASERSGARYFPAPDGGWWYGFDCSHYGDLDPGMAEHHTDPILQGDGVYRTVFYAEHEARRLAEQLVNLWPACESATAQG